MIHSKRQRLALNELFRRSILRGAALRQVKRLMSSPRRHYHGLGHLADLWIEHRRRSRATMLRGRHNQGLIASAIIFHDAIYHPERCDNEAASARLWRRRARLGHRLPRRVVEHVAALIEATADHATDGSGTSPDPALHWMLDLDLASIGAPRQRFRQNSSALRAEFVYVPAEEWQRRTCGFFAALASRSRIYRSRRINLAFEAQARANIAHELRLRRRASGLRGP